MTSTGDPYPDINVCKLVEADDKERLIDLDSLVRMCILGILEVVTLNRRISG
jgi:hypothetical protein